MKMAFGANGSASVGLDELTKINKVQHSNSYNSILVLKIPMAKRALIERVMTISQYSHEFENSTTAKTILLINIDQQV